MAISSKNQALLPESEPTTMEAGTAEPTGQVGLDMSAARVLQPDSIELARIRKCLGGAYYDRHGVLLYNFDCVAALDRIGEPTFDLSVTSPPYNLQKEYEAPRTLAEYLDWMETWIAAVHGTTVDDGALWLNLGYTTLPGRAKAIPIPYLLWDRVPFFMVQEVVWHYGAGVAARRSFSPRNEKFLWYVKDPEIYHFDLDAVRDPNVKYPNQRKNGKLKVNPAGKNPSDVWIVPKVTSGHQRSSRERTAHPAQFPLAVIQRIVKACSEPSDLILDPLIGSGTTAVAAVLEGRRAVGFELNSRYLDIAIQRIEQAASFAQMDLLGAPSR